VLTAARMAPVLRPLRRHGDRVLLAVLVAVLFVLPRGLPAGVIALGGITGLAVALNALGLLVVYRSTRIINLAQIAFGFVTAVWFYLWVEHLQWIVVLHAVCSGCVPDAPAHVSLQRHPEALLAALRGAHSSWSGFLLQANFWISLLLAVALGVASAWGAGVVATRYWAKAPRLVPTVAMLGFGISMTVGTASVTTMRNASFSSIFGLVHFRTLHPFRWWPYDESHALQQQFGGGGGGSQQLGNFYMPYRDHPLHVGNTSLHLADEMTLVVALAVFALVFAYFRFARAGVVIRGLSENIDRAQTLGIDAQRLVRRTWAVAGLLSALVGALAVVQSGFFVVSGPLDLRVLGMALTVAVLARFSSIPLALVAGIALGVIDQGLFWNYNKDSAYDGVLFLVVSLVLLLQASRATRAEQEASVAWLASPEIRPTPRELRRLPAVQGWRRAGVIIAIVAVIGVPIITNPAQLVTGTHILIDATLGLSLLLLMGWAGQISLGQVALAAVGAYVTVAASIVGHVPLLLGLLLGGLASAAAAVAVGIPALRLRGPFLIVMTLLFTVAVTDTLLSPAVLGGKIPVGFSRPLLLGLDLNDERVLYYVCLVFLALAVAATYGLKRARTRRALIAARDNEPAAQVFGVGITRTRLEAFAVSGFLAGIAGSLLAFETHGVTGGTFSVELSAIVLLIIVIGGAGSLAGPRVGGGYLGLFSLLGAAWVNFATGAAATVLLQFAPGGLGGLFFRFRDTVLRRLAIRNRISVPSLLADFSRTGRGAIRARIAPLRAAGGGSALVPVVHRRTGPGPGPVAGTWLGPRGAEDGRVVELEPVALVDDQALLTCTRVNVHYDQAQALFEVDFTVNAGEIVCLVGTNGAGKTTLLNAIAGLHHASGGSIRYDGQDITHSAAHVVGVRGLVMVPGGGGVFPSLTVAENLAVAAWANPDGAKSRYSEVLTAFPRLAERLTVRAGDLSGGEQQMLAIAQAYVVRPRLLMVDELSLGLSPQIVETILTLLRRMRDEGAGIVVVEQSVNLSITVATRAVVLEKGEVRFAGSSRQLLNHPELFASITFGAAGAGVIGGSELSRRRRDYDATRETALVVNDISTSYGGVVAVDGVNLDVRAGEVVGIIGPNGAGKTTLFDVISGFQRAHAGAILLLGADVTAESATARARLGLQRSFQSVRLFPSLSVRDNIAVAMENHVTTKSAVFAGLWLPNARRSERRVAQRVDMLIELMGLEPHAEKVMAEMSTGTRRIVDIACQLAARPKVLLLDEPSSGLAQTETEELGPVIARISKDLDCAVLVIEHDISLVSSISERLVAMERGRVIATGSATDVLSDPAVRAAYFGGASEEVIHRSGQAAVVPAQEAVRV
jgi:ABC-type branched-subunit amino acid transport system ATPase component/ABC-type branched-subunit amino acid transport system permease subunit